MKKYLLPAGIIAVILAIAILLFARPWGGHSGPKEFNIAFNQWVGFAPFFLAKEQGYFGDLPVSLHFVDLEGDKRAGLYAGRFDMICETMDMFQTSRDNADYPGNVVFAID